METFVVYIKNRSSNSEKRFSADDLYGDAYYLYLRDEQGSIVAAFAREDVIGVRKNSANVG